ncbi:MAG: extracellular solute-binding protein [Alphaproteobacteria bacterium]|nr:extracellular solute-binding protein [Alphaproteobacteria bacterium]
MIKRVLGIALKSGVLLGLATSPAWAGGDLAMAKKEGKVVWYSSISLPIAQQMCNAFNDKKMGFECVLHRSGSGKLYKRWVQEAKSKIFEADILHTSNAGHFLTLQKQGVFIKYAPEGTEKFPAAFKGEGGYWTVLRSFAYVPAYNTTKVKGGDIPTSWLDLLDPKWQGKIVNAHPSYSGSVSVGMSMLVKKFGWEFMDKLSALKPRVVQSAVDTTTYLVRGESDVTSGTASYTLFNAIKKGEKVKMLLPKEGVPFIISPQAIFKSAPHPNAAKIFADWTFSKEAQQILTNRGLYVGHPGVKYPEGQVPLNKLKLMTMSPAEATKMRKKIRTTFRKKFGV